MYKVALLDISGGAAPSASMIFSSRDSEKSYAGFGFSFSACAGTLEFATSSTAPSTIAHIRLLRRCPLLSCLDLVVRRFHQSVERLVKKSISSRSVPTNLCRHAITSILFG